MSDKIREHIKSALIPDSSGQEFPNAVYTWVTLPWARGQAAKAAAFALTSLQSPECLEAAAKASWEMVRLVDTGAPAIPWAELQECEKRIERFSITAAIKAAVAQLEGESG